MINPGSKEFQEVYFNTIAAETKRRRRKGKRKITDNVFDELGIDRV